MNIHSLLIMTLALMTVASVYALKPKWVSNTPKELNHTYMFVEVLSQGSDISSARMNAFTCLSHDRQVADSVEVAIERGAITNIIQKITNGEVTEVIKDTTTIKVTVKGQQYRLQAQKVDEWIAGRKDGQIQLYTLFMVALCDNPVFDRTYLTTGYGAVPVLLSVIPGVGQMHKGSTAKGIGILAAETLCTGGIILCENQRAAYRNKMHEQPHFKKSYKTKSENWQTGRNICIGAAAAVWVWNIIDAAVAKGARRVKVKRRDYNMSLSPMVGLQESGMHIVLNF